MSPPEKLLSALRTLAGHRRRVSLDDVWRAFARAFPGYAGDVETRPRLSALLSDLEREGVLALPKTKKTMGSRSRAPASAVGRAFQAAG